MVVKRIHNKFDILYCSSSALRIAHKLGFSIRKPRPIPYNSATPEEQKKFIEKTRKIIARCGKEGRVVLAIDASTMQDSPVSRRGLRRRGGKEVVGTNYSRKSLNIIGVLGNGILDLDFPEDLKASSFIALVERARQRYKKIMIVADNAKALTGKAMREYIESTNGDVEMIHFLSHTPQLNPIEMVWREIKAAKADFFFGSLENLKEAILNMLRKKEIP